MNKLLKPALVIAVSLAVLAPSFGAETAGDKANGDVEITAIAKKVYPSVVRVEVDSSRLQVMATGVVVEKGGYVVTTALVLPRDEKIILTTSEGRKVEAEFLGFDTETQIALLKAKDPGLPALPLGRSSDLSAGSWIAVVGVSPERTASVTQGIVSSVAPDKLRLNVWVTPGSSGGPVVDENGRMVGLLRGIYMDERPVVFQFRDREQAGSGMVLSNRAEAPSSGMALAVPIEVVADVSGQIKDKGRVERGWLGVGIGEDEDGRTIIGSVEQESPAELAKLRVGDVVLKIGDRDVPSPDVLAAEIRKRKPGQDIVLKIERDGKPMDVKVKLGELAEDDARKEMTLRFPGLFEPRGPEAVPKRAEPWPLEPRARAWAFESRRYIGIYCEELSPELAGHFGVKEGRALIISRLTEDGPAAKAKLRVGDVVVKVDGQRVETVNQLIDLVQDKEKGAKVKVEILRDKKPMTFDVEVSEEERGGLPEDSGLRSFLESWQGYTEALQKELQSSPLKDRLLKGFALKGTQRRI